MIGVSGILGAVREGRASPLLRPSARNGGQCRRRPIAHCAQGKHDRFYRMIPRTSTVFYSTGTILRRKGNGRIASAAFRFECFRFQGETRAKGNPKAGYNEPEPGAPGRQSTIWLGQFAAYSHLEASRGEHFVELERQSGR